MSNRWSQILERLLPNRPKNRREWILPTAAGSAKATQLAPGLYHYQRARDGQYLRFHLRIDPDGTGLLLAAAAEAIRLSPVAAVVARLLLEGSALDQAVESLTSDYRLSLPDAEQIVDQVNEVLNDLGRPDSRFPVFNLVDPSAASGDVRLMAPFQADLEIDLSSSADAQRNRGLIDRLWEAAIPHVRLLVGQADSQASMRPEMLVASVTHAEDIGMITGLQATAKAITQGDLLEQLAGVGLDYVVIPWAITRAAHAAIYGADDFEQLPGAILKVQQLEMTPVLQVPLVDPVADELEEQLEQLDRWKISHLEVFAIVDAASDTGADPHADGASSHSEAAEKRSGEAGDDQALSALRGRELRQLAASTEDLSARNPLQITWLPPVAVARVPRAAGSAILAGPRAGGDVSIRVAANGDVMAPRGPADIAGNLLTQPWETIWRQAVFDRLRHLVERETRCDQCPGLAICAAACPADPAGWALSATNAAEDSGEAAGKEETRD